MPVGEVKVLFPIPGCNLVVAGPDVVSDGFTDRLVDGRLFCDSQASQSKQVINGIGMPGSQKFTAWITPAILLGACDVDGSRRDRSDQQVRIDRQSRFVVAVLPCASQRRGGFPDAASRAMSLHRSPSDHRSRPAGSAVHTSALWIRHSSYLAAPGRSRWAKARLSGAEYSRQIAC
jgi:hypothetical protein